MDESQKDLSQSSEFKNVLPDVVHSQQIPTLETLEDVDVNETTNATQEEKNAQDAEDVSGTESISEHIPFKVEYSITESEPGQSESHNLLKIESNSANISKHNSLSIPLSNQEIEVSPNQLEISQQSSWNLDVNQSDIHISEESPVVLALSSDTSKDVQKSKSLLSDKHETPEESPRSEYIDSLNDNSNNKSIESTNDNNSREKCNLSIDNEPQSLGHCSSGSEEIIKLDIRGQAAPRFPLQAAKIIFGPPPDGSTIIGPNLEPLPMFHNLLSPCLVVANDGVKVEEVFEDKPSSPKKEALELSLTPSASSASDKIEQDVLVEELTVEDEVKEQVKDGTGTVPPKSFAPDDTMSFSTLSTDYKTICEEYHIKLVHLEEAITHRDQLIEELTVSLQRSLRERDDLKHDNEHLTNEVQNLQHLAAERSHSDHDTIKAQLSDFMKYQNMLKDDSTKFYSALMSGTASLQSSNGEKDMDREEITVNYSKSDLRSSGSSEEFPTGFENKLTSLLNKFEGYIEENLRNKLRESLIQVLCDEIGKMRVEYDTDVKEVETQIKRDKLAYTIETRKLRELLASVKAGNVDIDELRLELNIKHEKEMENLRTYFEKKCSDMERSYSEEVWRDRACASCASSPEPAAPAAGDAARPPAPQTSTPVDNTLKQANKKLEKQLEDIKAEHITYINELHARHKETIASLEEQITELKAHIQTAENTEGNVPLYQQDIDLELEKAAARRDERVRRGVLRDMQDQLQVLLSDPDAELSSWPLELVALRDRIYAEKPQDNELSSVRDELSPGEADKRRQRRNNSFDQNRQLEEVTKERDGLKRVAVTLQRAVTQLVAYCASAEDELNKTVLAHLLGQLSVQDQTLDLDSRPSTPNLTDLNSSLVSRTKHVHFAPDLDSILVSLDEEGVVGFLQQQRDLSADIKRELEHSLKRLRDEAHELLELSARCATGRVRQESNMLESSAVQITELVQEMDNNTKTCDNCELQKKVLEEALSEGCEREAALRTDLESAAMRLAQLLAERGPSDVIAEGYGTGAGTLAACAGACRSLDDASSPRSQLARAAHDLDLALRERDDLQQQLEAANRQLRATRQFVEEQAGEREAERDEFAARLRALRDDNQRLSARLLAGARVLAEIRCLRLPQCNCREHNAHVEQLEAQARDMNQMITDLETRKAEADERVKATEEKISLLRDIIANLEGQLEQKTTHEAEVLEQLERMRRTIDDRDDNVRALLRELDELRSERRESTPPLCERCGRDQEQYADLLEKVKEQARLLEERLAHRARRLERAYERGGAGGAGGAGGEGASEDVSLRERLASPCSSPSPRGGGAAELCGAWERLQAVVRAEDAALKRIADLEMQRAQLADVAQEVRAERDVLQSRMSEQALRISSLSARLQQQRNDAEALAHTAASDLSVQLHDAHAEVQRLKEELESKDKQLMRLKQNSGEREKFVDQQQSLYGNSCNPNDKVVILERELLNAQSKIAQLEGVVTSLEMDKDKLKSTVKEYERALAEKEDQFNDIMALKLEDEQNQNQRSEIIEAKTSARTLSDIVSISEFDEQDLQMRRAELKAHNLSLHGIECKDKTNLNRTLPPEVQRPYMSSLNADYVDHFDATNFTPRADSLPIHLTSTQMKDAYKRNANETTLFGMIDKLGDSVKHSTAQNIPDNCSMYPNRDISDSKNISVEPKKINFSLETSDNKMQEDVFTSLRELGITLDVKQENFPDILTQLKHEIKKSRRELEACKSDLKNAEEQLCEFPALKEEVEELKGLLENTMATMENDKKFYENQLENFSSNKKLLEQRLAELTQEAGEKANDLHLLKEDILRRENMILELAKEKRNLTNKITDLETKITELQTKNADIDKYETENKQLREKINELQKLEQLVSEKNQQIDSLNQHLDRMDDLQRCLNDKKEEMENIKEALEEKSNELFQLQDSVKSLNSDIAKVIEENDQLSYDNKDLKLKLSKLEKEQENASMKLQNSETELQRVNSLNNDLTSRIEELKLLNDKLKDKETEIEILHEDINSYHNEIASLKEQLKMVSRSPSPGTKSEEKKSPDRQASSDKKQLVKIKKQITLLQHELDFHKKELNDKAFELAKAKLDLTEARTNMSQVTKQLSDEHTENTELQRRSHALQQQLEQLTAEKQQLSQQLEVVIARLREESDVSELKEKLREKAERCQQLEAELGNMRDVFDRSRRARSPTAELERALRDQLDYSRALDERLVDQILSASSDEREDVPRLALNTSNCSTSSIQSSSSERLHRLRNENEKLEMQVNNLQCRLQDKDALIAELNRVRDKLSQESQSAQLRLEAERDNSARLALLLDAQKDTADTLHNQDSSMIEMLKRRLEGAMKSELEVQEREQELLQRLHRLERAQPPAEPSDQLKQDEERASRLRGEVSLLRSQLSLERRRNDELQSAAAAARAHAQRDREAAARAAADAHARLAELRRLKHETGVELVRTKEILHSQTATVAQLEKKLAAVTKHRSVNTFTEIENEKSELAREMATLRRCLTEDSPELLQLRADKQRLQEQLAQLRDELDARNNLTGDEKEQAIRYLHGRWIRLESCRKALVWQKRYLQRVVAGYAELERRLRLPPTPSPHSRGLRRFKCAVWAVVAARRMAFLVRRREHTRALAAGALLRAPDAHKPGTPVSSTPCRESAGGSARRSLLRVRPLKPSCSPAVPESLQRLQFGVNSPHDEHLVLSSPRGDASYQHKLGAVSRRLACAARDTTRDTP
ncbi:golgin subfamily B member 1-like [Vanessa tameamea]|uniref:Golgin subfamily B member 1-like n=1 Tax=Vanessa tameamea TaxID=334116 RepID=A0ABM4AQC8_VANTA